jgi:hypothetical protein
MKSKLSTKVLGIIVTVATLASLLVGITAAPAGVSAATNQMVFSATYSLPSNIGYLLGGTRYTTFVAPSLTSTTPDAYIPGPVINAVTISPDGNSIYAWDNAAKSLYYSSNAGKSYTSIGINVGAFAFVGMEISPKFSTDGGIVVLVNQGEVWVVYGGLANVAPVQQSTLNQYLGIAPAPVGVITSFDVAPYYGTGETTIFVGIAGGDATKSNVIQFKMTSNVLGSSWTENGAAHVVTSPVTDNGFLRTPDYAVDPAVLAVKAGPNYQTDATLMCVYTNATDTYLAANVGGLGWNGSMLPTKTINNTAVVPYVAMPSSTYATIAVGTDFIGTTSGVVLVGASNATISNLYITKNWIGGTTSYSSTGILAGAVLGVAVSGPIATGSVIVSAPGTVNLNISTSVTASTVTWTGSAPYRIPSGTAISSMFYGGANNAKLLVSTTGAGGAVNVSTDNGNTFNQIGPINIGGSFGTSYSGFSMVSDTNWYVRANSGLFQSTDKGVSWTRIFFGTWGTPPPGLTTLAGVNGMSRSVNFATNNTFYLTNGSNIALVTSNGGSTYTPVPLPVAVGSFNLIENDAWYMVAPATDANNVVIPAAFYTSTRPFVNATFTPTSLNGIASVTRKSADKTLMTYAIGGCNGTVYQSTDGGVTFNQLGSGPGGAGDKMSVSYTPDGNLWVAATGNVGSATAPFIALPTVGGVYEWIASTSTWQQIMTLAAPVQEYQYVYSFTSVPAYTVAAPTTTTTVTPKIAAFTVTGDGTMYATADFAVSFKDPVATSPTFGNTYVADILGRGIFRSLDYNTVNSAGASTATWAKIDSTTFPGGLSTTAFGSSSTGYPGGSAVYFPSANFTTAYPGVTLSAATTGLTTLSVVAQAATGNTLAITEKTSTITNSNVPQAIYTFVDTYIAGPAIVSPKDKTVLSTDTSVTLSWTALNGPAGGVTVATPNTLTNYDVQVTASTDFSGATTPLFDTANTGLALQNMDYYKPGNTTASMGVNPGAPTYALKSGTNYSWRVQAISPIPSRYSTATFTTALSAVTNPTQNNAFPANGATGVPIDTTFTWPAVTGTNVTYEFVIAEETGQTDKFAIIDYSATCPTNATPLRETLKPNTQYWWRVRATNGATTSAWSTYFFTTAAAVTTPTTTANNTITLPQPTSTVITITQPITTFTFTSTGTGTGTIPPALLWAVIAIGAVLIIAVIVLIVRTRRIP